MRLSKRGRDRQRDSASGARIVFNMTTRASKGGWEKDGGTGEWERRPERGALAHAIAGIKVAWAWRHRGEWRRRRVCVRAKLAPHGRRVTWRRHRADSAATHAQTNASRAVRQEVHKGGREQVATKLSEIDLRGKACKGGTGFAPESVQKNPYRLHVLSEVDWYAQNPGWKWDKVERRDRRAIEKAAAGEGRGRESGVGLCKGTREREQHSGVEAGM
ncbi:hypothetical protein B0H11DRAFT_1931490 [Mycena galericulata]|nr:hypothetical protein B0H11DRAFT_1931490 [Mycena galericulata]